MTTTHRITADCQPSFPCWLWDSENQWTHHASPVPSKYLARLGYLYFSTLPASQKPEGVEQTMMEAASTPEKAERLVEAFCCPAPTFPALAEKAAREIEFACGKSASDPARAKTTAIITRHLAPLTAALAQSEAAKAGLIQDVNNLQRGMEGLKAALAEVEGERDMAIAAERRTQLQMVEDAKERDALRADKERLDWLEKKDPQPYYENGSWHIPYLMAGEGGSGGGVGQHNGVSLRAVIDAARTQRTGE